MPRGQVTEIQRSRMLAAAVDAVDEVGYAHMTVAQVISRARVSRKTFYDVFADREDCFLAAFEQALEQAARSSREAYDARTPGATGSAPALARPARAHGRRAGLAKLCVVEALAAGEQRARAPRPAARRARREPSTAGRHARDATRRPADGHRRGRRRRRLRGAARASAREGSREPLIDLLGPLMSMIVLPYLGTRAASREAQSARTPRPRAAPPRSARAAAATTRSRA